MCFCLKNDISPHVRRAVAHAMGNLPGPSQLVIAALTDAMDDNYKQVRSAAGSSISRFGARAKRALPNLLKMYNDEKDWGARQQTLSALVQIDRKNPKVVEAVVGALDDPQLMHSALSYLQQLGVDAAPAVPRLIKILEPENNINVRVQSANTLGAIGPKAQSALPTLTKLSETRLIIIGSKVVKVSRELAEEHYKHLGSKPFFEDLIVYIQGKYHDCERVLALIYQGKNAIRLVRSIAGATNPEEAEPTSIRGAYGRITTKGVYENVIHASSNEQEATR